MNEINSNAVARLLERLEHPMYFVPEGTPLSDRIQIEEDPQEALAIICRALLDRKVIPA